MEIFGSDNGSDGYRNLQGKQVISQHGNIFHNTGTFEVLNVSKA